MVYTQTRDPFLVQAWTWEPSTEPRAARVPLTDIICVSQLYNVCGRSAGTGAHRYGRAGLHKVSAPSLHNYLSSRCVSQLDHFLDFAEFGGRARGYIIFGDGVEQFSRCESYKSTVRTPCVLGVARVHAVFRRILELRGEMRGNLPSNDRWSAGRGR